MELTIIVAIFPDYLTFQFSLRTPISKTYPLFKQTVLFNLKLQGIKGCEVHKWMEWGGNEQVTVNPQRLQCSDIIQEFQGAKLFIARPNGSGVNAGLAQVYSLQMMICSLTSHMSFIGFSLIQAFLRWTKKEKSSQKVRNKKGAILWRVEMFSMRFYYSKHF